MSHLILVSNVIQLLVNFTIFFKNVIELQQKFSSIEDLVSSSVSIALLFRLFELFSRCPLPTTTVPVLLLSRKDCLFFYQKSIILNHLQFRNTVYFAQLTYLLNILLQLLHVLTLNVSAMLITFIIQTKEDIKNSNTQPSDGWLHCFIN